MTSHKTPWNPSRRALVRVKNPLPAPTHCLFSAAPVVIANLRSRVWRLAVGLPLHGQELPRLRGHASVHEHPAGHPGGCADAAGPDAHEVGIQPDLGEPAHDALGGLHLAGRATRHR